eukprot:TRINITY_DN271_c0_g2_i1.p1 TRINITY_DN271_c0_g2~~TRINITY_DN271_c0_g2_i1.p1  ORF type:complete len:664 (-),score=141.97 TRINITY_DN271_c0_g2_i1:52-2043(-)
MTSYLKHISGVAGDSANEDGLLDVDSVFRFYNSRYFNNKLNAVKVLWRDDMYTVAGEFLCTRYSKSIHLSRKLLVLRPRNDTISILLHEMIHAYLFLTRQVPKVDDHGELFQKMMNDINQKENLNINVYHTFLEEVKYYLSHHWECSACTVVMQLIESQPPKRCEVCGNPRLSLIKTPETTIEQVTKDHTSASGTNSQSTKKKTITIPKPNPSSKQSSLDRFLNNNTGAKSSPSSSSSSTTSVRTREVIEIKDDDDDDDDHPDDRPTKRKREEKDEVEFEGRTLCDIEPQIKRKLPLSKVQDNKRNRIANADAAKATMPNSIKSKENTSKIPILVAPTPKPTAKKKSPAIKPNHVTSNQTKLDLHVQRLPQAPVSQNDRSEAARDEVLSPSKQPSLKLSKKKKDDTSVTLDGSNESGASMEEANDRVASAINQLALKWGDRFVSVPVLLQKEALKSIKTKHFSDLPKQYEPLPKFETQKRNDVDVATETLPLESLLHSQRLPLLPGSYLPTLLKKDSQRTDYDRTEQPSVSNSTSTHEVLKISESRSDGLSSLCALPQNQPTATIKATTSTATTTHPTIAPTSNGDVKRRVLAPITKVNNQKDVPKTVAVGSKSGNGAEKSEGVVKLLAACPVCGMDFSPQTSNESRQQHINSCLECTISDFD